ncbi:hypothetical protein BDZ97DRAFT_1618016, partial [Flammula alnicola]
TGQRTIWDILWSCLFTIFACSWVAVHPNMPAPGAKWWRVALTRLELMAWTIIVPELMIFWAMRQWFGARKLERMYRDEGWTMTHGYFIQMGGFTLFHGDAPKEVLSPKRLKYLAAKGEIEFPNITEEEIQDRSKGDALSKTLVIGQTTWFIAQCISRKAQGLVTTELELVTLGFAVLNAFMYYFWWNKPLDVRKSVPVYLLNTPKGNEGQLIEYDNNRYGNTVETPNTTGSTRTPDFNMAKFHPHKLKVILDVSTILSNIFYRWPVNAVVAIFSRIGDMSSLTSSTDIVMRGEMQVHTFYAMELTIAQGSRALVCISLIGMIFGAIHCAGWNFLFPSHSELILWQVSSLVITAVPFSLALVILLQLTFPSPSNFAERVLHTFSDFTIEYIVAACIPLYVLARLALLAEAFVTLRDLPPGALAVVQWTSFLPHI